MGKILTERFQYTAIALFADTQIDIAITRDRILKENGIFVNGINQPKKKASSLFIKYI